MPKDPEARDDRRTENDSITGKPRQIVPTRCPKGHRFPYYADVEPTRCPNPGCGSTGPFTREMKLRG